MQEADSAQKKLLEAKLQEAVLAGIGLPSTKRPPFIGAYLRACSLEEPLPEGSRALTDTSKVSGELAELAVVLSAALNFATESGEGDPLALMADYFQLNFDPHVPPSEEKASSSEQASSSDQAAPLTGPDGERVAREGYELVWETGHNMSGVPYKLLVERPLLSSRSRMREDVFQRAGEARSGLLESEEDVGEHLLRIQRERGGQAVPKIIEKMREDMRPGVLTMGCQALATISETDHGRTNVLAQNGHGIVKSAMDDHVDNEPLQVKGVMALGKMVLEQGEEQTLACGGLEAVLRAMANHSTYLIQLKGCVALGNFAYGDAGEAATTAGGGIGAILGAIKTHTTDAKLIEEACDALSNLIGSDAGREACLALGGVALLEAARSKHFALSGPLECLAMLRGDGGGSEEED